MTVDRKTRITKDGNHLEVYTDTRTKTIRICQQSADAKGVSSQNIYMEPRYWGDDECIAILNAITEGIEMLMPEPAEETDEELA